MSWLPIQVFGSFCSSVLRVLVIFAHPGSEVLVTFPSNRLCCCFFKRSILYFVCVLVNVDRMMSLPQCDWHGVVPIAHVSTVLKVHLCILLFLDRLWAAAAQKNVETTQTTETTVPGKISDYQCVCDCLSSKPKSFHSELWVHCLTNTCARSHCDLRDLAFICICREPQSQLPEASAQEWGVIIHRRDSVLHAAPLKTASFIQMLFC